MYSLLRYRRRPAASLHSASKMFLQWRAPMRSNSRTSLGNRLDAYAELSRDSKSVGGGDRDGGESGDRDGGEGGDGDEGVGGDGDGGEGGNGVGGEGGDGDGGEGRDGDRGEGGDGDGGEDDGASLAAQIVS